MSQPPRRWWDLIPQLPKWILSAVTFVAALVGFIELIRGDGKLVATVSLVVAGLGAWLASAYLVFRRSPPDASARRHPGTLRVIGLATLVLIPLLAVGSVLYVLRPPKDPIAPYTDAIGRDPGNADLWARRAGAYAKNRQFDAAVKDYTEALNRDPDNAGLHKYRGTAYLELGKHDQAINDYNRSIEIDSKDTSAYVYLGIAYKETGIYDKAIENFEKAIVQLPRYGWAYKHLGSVYVALHQYDKAMESFDKSIAYSSSTPDADAYIQRGHLHDELGNTRMAIADYQEAVRLEPNDAADAYRMLSFAYRKIRAFPAAIDSAKKFLDVNEDPGMETMMREHLRELEGQAP